MERTDKRATMRLPEWRFGRGWSASELESHVNRLHELAPSAAETWERMTVERQWNRFSSEAVIGQERSGPPIPDGPFQRARTALENYQFSDPRIVVAHFDPGTPLLGRLLLLEIKVWRLHYLNGVVIGDVRNDNAGGTTTFGFRYDTLEGHLECGSEWFTLRKDHASGTVRHRIEAAYREGAFPNWWSRVGFKLFAERLQRLWHYRAQERLYLLAHHGVFGDLSCGGSLTACRSAARGDAHARPCVRTRGSSRVALCAGRFRYLPPTDDRTRFTAHAISSGSSLGTAWLVLLETTSALCSDCRAHSRSTVMR
jgi:uncharacterized protein (UPF0548 family)